MDLFHLPDKSGNVSKEPRMPVFTWKKLGRILDPKAIEKKTWMSEFSQAPCALVFDQFVRVYFCCRPEADSDGQYVSYGAFADLKRDNLSEILKISSKPILELGQAGTFDEFGTNPISVIRDGEDVRAYYAGWTRCESVPVNAAIGVAVSHDNGETFKRIGTGPVLSYSIDEPFVLGSPRVRRYDGLWYLWYVAGKEWIANDVRNEAVYRIRVATSPDGLNWNKTGKELIPAVLGEDECQASPDVFRYKGRYHMYFSYRYAVDFKNQERGYRIGYASSLDLIKWIRDDKRAGIDVSESGWDSEMVSYPHIFELDGKVLMLYQGNEIGRTGFGLAELELYES